MRMMKQASSTIMDAITPAPAGFVRRASAALADAPLGMARRASNTIIAIKDAIAPSQEVGLDVLGLSLDEESEVHNERNSAFEEDDLFEVDVEDENGDLSPMVRACYHRTILPPSPQPTRATPFQVRAPSVRPHMPWRPPQGRASTDRLCSPALPCAASRRSPGST